MTTITTLPPAPDRSDPSTFASKADAFVAALPTLVTEINTVAGEVNTNANNASTSATTATTKASEALTSANNSASSAELAEDWATSLTEVSGGLYGARKYAQEAANAVSALPDGTINDSITTVTDTWSSSKISSELSGKADTATLATKLDIDDVATINGLPLTGGGNITIDAGGVGGGETLSTSLVKTTGNGIVNTGLTITTTVGVSPAITIDADRTLLLIGQNGWLIAACHSKTTGFGAASVIRASGDFGVSGSCAVGKLIDMNKVLVASVPASSTAFQSVVLSLTGTTITVGVATATTLPTSSATDPFGLQAENPTGIVTVNATHLISYLGGYVVAMTVSGTTVTAAATADLLTGWNAPHPALLYANGANLIVVSTSLSATERTSAIASCSVSGTTVTAGASVALVSGAYASVVNLGGGKFARVSSTSAGGVTGEIITQSGTTVSKTSVSLMVSTGVSQPVVSANAISASQIVVASNISGFARINVLTDSSGTAVAGTVLALPTASSGIFGDFGVRDGASVLTMFTTSSNAAAVLRVASNGNNPAIVGGSAFFLPTSSGWLGSAAYFGDATNARGQQLVGTTVTTHLKSEPLAMAASDSGEGFAIFAPTTGLLSRQSNSAIWHYREIGSTRIAFTKVEVF